MDRTPPQLEAMARELEASGQFKVLRKLVPRQRVTPPDGSQTRLGLFFDVETTGLDPSRDEIIKKLTRDNPTMAAKFAELKNHGSSDAE
jgi:DNA polymerase-3 subunit epsilon